MPPFRRILFSTVAALALSLAVPAGASAFGYTVDKTSGSPSSPAGACSDAVANDCSLHDAVANNNTNSGANNTILFSLPANSTINLASELDPIRGTLTIQGTAPADTGVTVSGQDQRRIFEIADSTIAGAATVGILDLNMTNGRHAPSASSAGGGAIRVGVDATLIIQRCRR